MSKRRGVFCGVAAALLLVLGGCGGGTGGADEPAAVPPVTESGAGLTDWDPADFAQVYEVGPGQPYADPSAVPWESLGPSTLVRIHYRDTPYRSKWVVTTTATEAAPLVIVGVPDGGRLPVISGDGATTRSTLYYLNEVRSVVKVGNYTGSGDSDRPAYVFLQGLEIRSGRPPYTFTDRAGLSRSYSSNAAAVHVEEGDHVTIQGCVLRDSGNGLFSSSLTSDLLLYANSIYDNGIEGSIYEHNSYTESLGIVFEANHYGPLRTGCLGNNLKDRSAGTVIRYNWIESGNRQLDLVETDYDHIFNDPGYDVTYVYGNILVEPDGAGNSQILHYGGDGGDTTMYRQGTLYFYQNTVVSTRSGNTTLLRLSTTPVQAQVANNILYATAGGSSLAITSGNGQTTLVGNWLPSGWRLTHEAALDPGASVVDLGNTEGSAPGFADATGQDFSLTATAAARNTAAALPVGLTTPPYQYLRHQQRVDRPLDEPVDIGAFEYAP